MAQVVKTEKYSVPGGQIGEFFASLSGVVADEDGKGGYTIEVDPVASPEALQVMRILSKLAGAVIKSAGAGSRDNTGRAQQVKLGDAAMESVVKLAGLQKTKEE